MSLGIEDVRRQNVDGTIRVKQQIDIFECLCQEEGFHLVIGFGGCIGNIGKFPESDRRLGVSFNGLKDFLSPCSIDWVLGDGMKVVERFHHFGSHNVLRRCRVGIRTCPIFR